MGFGSVWARLVGVAVAVALVGLGIGAVLHAQIGFAPVDVLFNGIDRRTALSHGQAAWLVFGLTFLIAAALGRPPTIWSLLFTLGAGPSVDAGNRWLPEPEAFAPRLFMFALGLAAASLSAALMLRSCASGGGFELLMTAGIDRGVSPTLIRVVLEVGSLVLGVAIGGQVGPGTLAFGLGIGPAIAWFLARM